METELRNVADETAIKKKTELERTKEILRRTDLRKILSWPEGRRFIWRYLEICGVFTLSFTGNSQTFFNEGQRNIGLKLLAEIMDVAPDALLQMMKDSKGEMDV